MEKAVYDMNYIVALFPEHTYRKLVNEQGIQRANKSEVATDSYKKVKELDVDNKD